MDIDFGGKIALITGGGSGLGRVTAEKLLQCNAKVVALDVDAVCLDDFKSKHPEIETVVADVADWEGVKKSIEGLGRIDLLVNNAGIMTLEKLGAVTEECLTRILDINVKSLINISQVVSNGMKQRGISGAIVNLCSISSDIPCPGMLAYGMSKTAVFMITRTMAFELGPHQIRVNSVSPSLIPTTAMGKTVLGFLSEIPEMVAALQQRQSLKKVVEAENIAEAIVFLLSDRASAIHGINIPVDAGVLSS